MDGAVEFVEFVGVGDEGNSHLLPFFSHLLPPETKCKADRRRFPVSGVDLETFEGHLLGGRSMAFPFGPFWQEFYTQQRMHTWVEPLCTRD
jgi:hypothetical protein